jgi:hypothetical protein
MQVLYLNANYYIDQGLVFLKAQAEYTLDEGVS